MNCPNCQFVNSAAAKNCFSCGSGMNELPEPQRKHVGEPETWPESHVGADGTRREAPDNVGMFGRK